MAVGGMAANATREESSPSETLRMFTTSPHLKRGVPGPGGKAPSNAQG